MNSLKLKLAEFSQRIAQQKVMRMLKLEVKPEVEEAMGTINRYLQVPDEQVPYYSILLLGDMIKEVENEDSPEDVANKAGWNEFLQNGLSQSRKGVVGNDGFVKIQ